MTAGHSGLLVVEHVKYKLLLSVFRRQQTLAGLTTPFPHVLQTVQGGGWEISLVAV